MSIQPEQLIRLILYVVFIAWFVRCIWTEKYKQSLIPLTVFIVAFFAMPVRNEIQGVSSLEQSRGFEKREVPERVTQDKPAFAAIREDKLTEIRLESKEIENEINN